MSGCAGTCSPSAPRSTCTPHWHGNTATVMGMRTDMAELLPGSMMVADMIPDAVGTWLYHCHVNDHIAAGMITRYRVTN